MLDFLAANESRQYNFHRVAVSRFYIKVQIRVTAVSHYDKTYAHLQVLFVSFSCIYVAVADNEESIF